MLKKIGLSFIIGALALTAFTTTAAAQPRYTTVDYTTIQHPLRYHNRDTATHYLWGWNHQQKLHNLRNYPHTTWSVTRSALWKHGTHVARYYYVVSGNQRTAGWVWHGFVTAGTAQKATPIITDGVHLTDSKYGITEGKTATMGLYLIQRLQDDGFVNNNYLDILNDYNASNDHTPNTFPLAQSIAIEKLGRHIDPAAVSAVEVDNVPDLAHWIDPKNGDLQLETTGRGQLGAHIADWTETQLKAHGAHQYSLRINLTGQLSQNRLQLQLILYMLN